MSTGRLALPNLDAAPASRPRAARRPLSLGWRTVAVLTAVTMAAPLAALVISGFAPDIELWRHLWATRLPQMISNTLALVALVALGTLVLGTSLAWLVTAYKFPGRSLMGWLLAMPLAMPGYVLGFLFVSSLDHPGPIQSWVRALFGPTSRLPDVRSLPWAAFVLTLTLYPYVFLLARAAFREQSSEMLEVARTAGLGPVRTFFRLVLPLARPSLAAGASLVVMETLTDFATVRLFNVQTLADGVFRVWFGLGDRRAATQLAVVLLAFATAVIALERFLRRRARYTQHHDASKGIEPAPLPGIKGFLAIVYAAGVVVIALAMPLVWLGTWARQAIARGLTATPVGGFFDHAYHSLFLAGLASLLCIGVATLLANAVRFESTPLVKASGRIATSGYSIPGAVVAVGVVLVLGGAGRVSAALGIQAVLTGSLAGLAYAYLVRYMAVGYYSVEASLSKVTPSITWSARTLGAGPLKVAWKVHLPMMRSGAVMAAALVFLDVMKELPATLLLRPFGYDTLAVWIWRMTSDSRWIEASVPSLALVAVSLVPIGIFVRYFERGEGALT